MVRIVSFIVELLRRASVQAPLFPRRSPDEAISTIHGTRM
jgi:hypothetical protein